MQHFYVFRPAFRNVLLLSLVLTVPVVAEPRPHEGAPNNQRHPQFLARI
jgi:hypothetical protein